MKKIIILFVFTILTSLSFVKAQENKFEAIFLYNFTRQLGWPEAYRSGDIIIKVFGETDIVDQINDFAKGNPVYGQNIVAKSTSIDGISDCHIVYITEDKSNELENVIAKIGMQSILIVTEEANLVSKGAGISFTREVDIDGEQILRYQYNTINIKKADIKLSSDFKSLGIEF